MDSGQGRCRNWLERFPVRRTRRTIMKSRLNIH